MIFNNKTISLLLCVLLISSCSQQDKSGIDKRVAIMEYFDISGYTEVIKRSTESRSNSWKEKYPDVPESFWQENLDDLITKTQNELINVHISVYEEMLTLDEVQLILEFTKSDTGKKLSEISHKITPNLTKRASEVGLQSDRNLQSLLAKEGYIE